jgi:hypothetical protein
MSEDLRQFMQQSANQSSATISSLNISVPLTSQVSHVPSPHDSPSLSSTASLSSLYFENVQSTNNSWIKMSECDEFIGPK